MRGCSKSQSVSLDDQISHSSEIRPQKEPNLLFVKKKRKLSPSCTLLVLSFTYVAIWNPCSSCGILTAFPFSAQSQTQRELSCFHRNGRETLIVSQLSYRLGPTYSKLNTIVSITFLTLVEKSLTFLLATSTKICTSGCSSRVHTRKPSTQPPHSPTCLCLRRFAQTLEYRREPFAPSIFGAPEFDR